MQAKELALANLLYTLDMREEKGYRLPKIIFWNVAAYTNGCPVTKYDNDVIMISGFSTNLLENIFNVEEYKPEAFMLTTLQKYIDMLK